MFLHGEYRPGVGLVLGSHWPFRPGRVLRTTPELDSVRDWMQANRHCQRLGYHSIKPGFDIWADSGIMFFACTLQCNALGAS